MEEFYMATCRIFRNNEAEAAEAQKGDLPCAEYGDCGLL